MAVDAVGAFGAGNFYIDEKSVANRTSRWDKGLQ